MSRYMAACWESALMVQLPLYLRQQIHRLEWKFLLVMHLLLCVGLIWISSWQSVDLELVTTARVIVHM